LALWIGDALERLKSPAVERIVLGVVSVIEDGAISADGHGGGGVGREKAGCYDELEEV